MAHIWHSHPHGGRVRIQKLMNLEIRSLIGKRKSLKRSLKSTDIDNDLNAKAYINLKVKKPECKIDKAIADYNSSFVKQHGWRFS